MSISKLNLEELELQFDAILKSFGEKELREWDRYNSYQEDLEKFFSGQNMPVETQGVNKIARACVPLFSCIEDIEVCDYPLNTAA